MKTKKAESYSLQIGRINGNLTGEADDTHQEERISAVLIGQEELFPVLKWEGAKEIPSNTPIFFCVVPHKNANSLVL